MFALSEAEYRNVLQHEKNKCHMFTVRLLDISPHFRLTGAPSTCNQCRERNRGRGTCVNVSEGGGELCSLPLGERPDRRTRQITTAAEYRKQSEGAAAAWPYLSSICGLRWR